MKGWFDAFRTDGGPTLYSYSNRTPVTGDVPSICLYVIFATIYIAFLLIFPGIRKQRFTTFLSVTLSVFVGFSICASQYGSSWHVADTTIQSYYRAFSREKVTADLGIHIGLMHFNVTLQGWTSTSVHVWNGSLNDSLHVHVSPSVGDDIDFNERFHWESAREVQEDYRAALVKGLPFPILTVAEYLNMDEEGFAWGRQYRLAGHYASVFLWFSFVSWILTMGLFLMVPRYGAYKMVVTGGLLLTTNFLYYILIPSNPIMIRFENQIVMFHFGWDFWRIFGAGILCGVVGTIIAIVDLLYPHKFSTILEVDYDTPYDRHIIIEESHHTTRKKKGSAGSLEDPSSLGLEKKMRRTVSSSNKENEGGGGGGGGGRGMKGGVENRGFEMDPPKSPWRYPYLMDRGREGSEFPPLRGTLANAFAKNPALLRLAAPNPSSKSPKSVSFRRQSRLETTYIEEPMREKRSDSKDSSGSSNFDIPLDNEFSTFQSQFQGRSERSDSQESGSTVSSFGLGLLSRTQSSRGDPHPHPHQPHLPHSILSPQLSGRHILLSPQFSGSNARGNLNGFDAHVPLSRIHYSHDHVGVGVGIHHLPRASLERKSSTSEGETSRGSSRRGSDTSSSKTPISSSPLSSAITSNSFDLGTIHEPQPMRRSSKERVRENVSGW